MKKLISHVNDVVIDMLEGYSLANQDVELLHKFKIIKRGSVDPNKVSLVSGGGSGHEPTHAGFVGKGMLDAAVCGDVFASPSQIQVYQAIKSVATPKGVLLIIKNYSGDVMNFQNAAFMAEEDGIRVDYVKVADDIAVKDSLYTVGHRGVAGTIFVHKLAGAAAERKKDLKEVKIIAQKTADSVKSFGFAFSSCTVPAKGSPTFSLADDDMEYGVGIHGEPGVSREKIMPADELALRIVEQLDGELNFADNGSRVALLVNGFGATPLMELYIFNKYVAKELLKKNVAIARTLVGNYMTSIDMAGASVSILKLDDELESLLNEPCETSGLSLKGMTPTVTEFGFDNTNEIDETQVSYEIETPNDFAKIGEKLSLNNIQYIVDAMSACIIRNEVPFCKLDSYAGDGDFGMSVAKGFRQLKREWKTILSAEDLDIGSFLERCAIIIMEYCGGASGPIWGSAFRAAGKASAGKKDLSVPEFAEVIQAAVKGIQSTGERSFGRAAVIGDKTLIDALAPCADAWSRFDENIDFQSAFRQGAEVARNGAKATEQLVARLGRAGTVGERSKGHPDAGAYALGVIFTEIAELLQ